MVKLLLGNLIYFIIYKFLIFSVELVQFRSQHDSTFVLVGCAVDLNLKPYKARAGCIYTFLLTSDGNRFEYIHKTPTDDVFFLIINF